MESTTEAMKGLDEALHKITYGFHIVTTRKDAEDLDTREEDYIAAGTVSWAMQSSFEPPMITIAIKNDSDLRETIERAKSFGFTILGKKDKDLISRFAGDSELSSSQINGIGFDSGPETNSPLLRAGIAHLECKVQETIDGPGDHVLFIGEVINAELRRDTSEPLYEWETRHHYGGTKS